MLLLVLIFVFVAFGLLLVALVTGLATWAWVSVAVSVAAAGLLVFDWTRRRATISDDDRVGVPVRTPTATMDPPTTAIPRPQQRADRSTDVIQPRSAPDPEWAAPGEPEARKDERERGTAPSGSPKQPSGAVPKADQSGEDRSQPVTVAGSDAPPQDASAADTPSDDTRSGAERRSEDVALADSDKVGSKAAPSGPVDKPVSNQDGPPTTVSDKSLTPKADAAPAAATSDKPSDKHGEGARKQGEGVDVASAAAAAGPKDKVAGRPADDAPIRAEEPSASGPAAPRGTGPKKEPAGEQPPVTEGKPSTAAQPPRKPGGEQSTAVRAEEGRPSVASQLFTSANPAVQPPAEPPAETPPAQAPAKAPPAQVPAETPPAQASAPAKTPAQGGPPRSGAPEGPPRAPAQSGPAQPPPPAQSGPAQQPAAAAGPTKSGAPGQPAQQQTAPVADLTTQAITPVRPRPEPGEERVVPAAAAIVATLDDEVLVVDERPRYHLAGCLSLTGKETIPLPAREAIEYEFTPCQVCTPVRVLAARHQAASKS